MDNSSDIINWLFLFLVSLKIKFPHLYFIQISASQIKGLIPLAIHTYITYTFISTSFIYILLALCYFMTQS